MSEVSGPHASGDHEREDLSEIEFDQDGDQLNKAFAAISDDPLEWAEQHAEMTDWADEGWRDERPE